MPDNEKAPAAERPRFERSGDVQRLVEGQTETRKGARTYRPRPAGEPRPAPPEASTSPSGNSGTSSDGSSDGDTGDSS